MPASPCTNMLPPTINIAAVPTMDSPFTRNEVKLGISLPIARLNCSYVLVAAILVR